jgi:type IX secretion system PorP/SprF family membrane protein
LIIQIGTLKFFTHFIFFVICNPVFSQDIHWSQINSNPLFQNPGNTGYFEADHRFSFNLKDQWRKVTKPFTSSSVGYDTKYRYYPKVGLGAIFISDVAGDGSFKTIETKLLGSYELFNKKNINSLRFGIDFGLNYREMNFKSYMYDNQYNGFFYDNSLPNIEDFITNNTINFTLSLGTIWTKKLNNKDKISIGLSSFNLNKPNQSYYGIKVERDIRNSLFFQYEKKLQHILLNPSLNISKQGKYTEIIFGTLISLPFKFKKTPTTIINFGIYHRIKDAIIFSLGTTYKEKLMFALSYDINISQLTKATNGRGSIEFSLIYLLYRKIMPKPKQIQCIEYL